MKGISEPSIMFCAYLQNAQTEIPRAEHGSLISRRVSQNFAQDIHSQRALKPAKPRTFIDILKNLEPKFAREIAHEQMRIEF